MEATIEEIRFAYTGLDRLFNEVKLDKDSVWRVSRMIGKLKPFVRDFEKSSAKLCRDAGAQLTQAGVSFDKFERKKDEEDEEFERRKEAHRAKVNQLQDDIDQLNEKVVEIDYDPIPFSMLPKERKNDKGDSVTVEYRATDLALIGNFIKGD